MLTLFNIIFKTKVENNPPFFLYAHIENYYYCYYFNLEKFPLTLKSKTVLGNLL
jgi:hypothetical protein